MTKSSADARTDILARVPLFTAYTPSELNEIAERFAEVAYARDQTVCTEGEDGDKFFVVLSGDLDVWGGKLPKRVISRLGPGECVGEMSLLTGAKRSATVTASRSSRLLALSKADFDRYLLQNPKALEYFSKLLCKRLATLGRGDAVTKATTTIAVTGLPGLKGKSLVAATLAGLLQAFTARPALLVRLGPSRRSQGPPGLALTELVEASSERIASHLKHHKAGPTQLSLRLDPADGASQYTVRLNALIAKLEDRFSFVVLDLGGEPAALEEAEADVCDVLIRIADRADLEAAAPHGSGTRVFRVLNLHNERTPEISIKHCEPFVLRVDPALRAFTADAQAAYIRANPDAPASPALHRLARKILGTSIGLALGSGAAFGVAHVGVMKVLEDGGIPVDLITGCSMGSVVAIGYAAGIRAQQMIDIAHRLGTKWTTASALDVTLTQPGILAGNRLVKIFAPFAGDVQRFDQLTRPCQVVATDIESGERVVIGDGRIDAAFRASCSVPLIWAPVRYEGRVLVDGGVVDPVPAEVVNDMGADICIAVNAVPQLQKGVETILSRVSKASKWINPLSYLTGSQDMPNMFDVIMNTIQTLQYELGNFKAIAADVRINLDLSGFTWIEFYRAKELIERGAEAAERMLPDIKRAIAERLAASAGSC